MGNCSEIKLHNRYGLDIRIRKDACADVCYLTGDFHYMRVIGSADGVDVITAIDPEGGEMISVGMELFGKRIETIRYNEDAGRWEFAIG